MKKKEKRKKQNKQQYSRSGHSNSAPASQIYSKSSHNFQVIYIFFIACGKRTDATNLKIEHYVHIFVTIHASSIKWRHTWVCSRWPSLGSDGGSWAGRPVGWLHLFSWGNTECVRRNTYYLSLFVTKQHKTRCTEMSKFAVLFTL